MKRKFRKYQDWAVITGGSNGIGFAFADQLAREGLNIVLVARREGPLQEAADTLRKRHGVKAETVALDMSVDGAPEALYEATQGKKVGMLVLSAGVETTGDYTKVDLASHRNLIKLNIQAPAELARLYGEDMSRRGSGGIVFLASLFAYQGVPTVANYSASKAYILSLGEGLNVEFKKRGVDVIVVSPGLTDTNMPAAMPVNFKKMPITLGKPEFVARVGLKSLGRKASVVPGFLNKIYAFENRFIPRMWPTKLFGFLMQRAMTPETRAELVEPRLRRVRS